MDQVSFQRRVQQALDKEISAMRKVIEPARAAANALADAGMKRTADPLQQALFEYQAAVDELRAFMSQPDFIEGFLNLLKAAGAEQR